jgi:hypothetical protein
LRTNRTAVSVLCSKGLLFWPEDVLGRLRTTGCFRGCSTLEEKQLHMVGYLFELAYNLMIAPQDNVSRSPGFESCLGIFGGNHD